MNITYCGTVYTVTNERDVSALLSSLRTLAELRRAS
jgi:hypothetical protein